jgi:hypothetical protein
LDSKRLVRTSSASSGLSQAIFSGELAEQLVPDPFLRGFGIQLAQSPFASAIGHNVLHFINDFIAEACGFGTP